MALNLLTFSHQDPIMILLKSLVLLAKELAISILSALIAQVQPHCPPQCPVKTRLLCQNTRVKTGLNNLNRGHHSNSDANSNLSFFPCQQ